MPASLCLPAGTGGRGCPPSASTHLVGKGHRSPSENGVRGGRGVPSRAPVSLHRPGTLSLRGLYYRMGARRLPRSCPLPGGTEAHCFRSSAIWHSPPPCPMPCLPIPACAQVPGNVARHSQVNRFQSKVWGVGGGWVGGFCRGGGRSLGSQT